MRQTKTVGYITQEAYKKGELHSEVRHEYIHGEVFAMAGASERHNRIAGNLFFQLRLTRQLVLVASQLTCTIYGCLLLSIFCVKRK